MAWEEEISAKLRNYFLDGIIVVVVATITQPDEVEQ